MSECYFLASVEVKFIYNQIFRKCIVVVVVVLVIIFRIFFSLSLSVHVAYAASLVINNKLRELKCRREREKELLNNNKKKDCSPSLLEVLNNSG